MRSNAGSRNPRVFPEPVRAIEIMSRPWRQIGQAWAWIGVGVENPAEARAAFMAAGQGEAANVDTCGGHTYGAVLVSFRPMISIWWRARNAVGVSLV